MTTVPAARLKLRRDSITFEVRVALVRAKEGIERCPLMTLDEAIEQSVLSGNLAQSPTFASFVEGEARETLADVAGRSPSAVFGPLAALAILAEAIEAETKAVSAP